MWWHSKITDRELRVMLRIGQIRFGGNQRLKIYGTLKCKSGRSMNKDNRIFFSTEQEALLVGYRPCGHCLSTAYKKWKHGIV